MRFKRALSDLAQFKTGRDQEAEECEKLRASALRLITLARDFVDIAMAYGRIIISEAHVPYEYKTIQPVALGGIAGGTLKSTCTIFV